MKLDAIWDYDINPHFNEVLQWMEDNDKTSILDLGAGLGDCLMAAKDVGHAVLGFENNPELLKDAPKEIIEKDILKIVKKNLKGYEVIYSWEPFKHPVKAKKFIEMVFKKLHKGQVLIYKAQKHMPRSIPYERCGQHFIAVK